MLIITNRTINENSIGNEKSFGDKLDTDNEGQQILRFAEANKKDSGWKVELIEETDASQDNTNAEVLSFEDRYCELRKNNKNCVFFIHGFNQSFKKNLKKCSDIEEIHLSLIHI